MRTKNNRSDSIIDVSKGNRLSTRQWHGLAIAAWLALAHTLVYGETERAERVPWRKVPIEIELVVGDERLVHFPGPVKLGLPGYLEPALRVQSVSGTVYLLASEPFGPTRIIVHQTDLRATYLIDLLASEGGESAGPLQIYLPDTVPDTPSGEGDPPAAPTSSSYGYVTLTRFAAQQLYAPSRLLRELPGVVRVPVKREAVALVRGGAVEATPLVAWRSGDLYLIAVKLVNRSSSPQTLDPRTLRGAWLTAAFQHNRLFPAGDETDTTALYLIAERPFNISARVR